MKNNKIYEANKLKELSREIKEKLEKKKNISIFEKFKNVSKKSIKKFFLKYF